MKEVAFFAVIEAEPHMDMYDNSGFTRWQPDLVVLVLHDLRLLQWHGQVAVAVNQ